MNLNLTDLGWNPFFKEAFDSINNKQLLPARIASEHRNLYNVYCAAGELEAHVSGRFKNGVRVRSDFPAVGDWVAIKPVAGESKAVIHHLLPRRSQFVRKQPVSGGKKKGKFEGISIMDGGSTDEQVLASNVDTLFIVAGLDQNYNIRRIERYLTQAYSSGAGPVILLNKADLCKEAAARVLEVEQIAGCVPVYAVSASRRSGLDYINSYLNKGQTAAFIGASGVGKSSLINAILGEEKQKVMAVSEAVGKGRHTTTSRDLILCPAGGLLMDTPGLREFQLWCELDDVDLSFEEIDVLRIQCRFSDCRHRTEPGCAVMQAMEEGKISEARYKEYLKYLREIRFLNMKKQQKTRPGKPGSRF